MNSRNIKINAIDLFCGVGGLTHGLEKAGINVKLGVDVDPECEFPYSSNNNAKFLLQSIEEIKIKTIKSTFGTNGFRLLAGCAPCQTFSTYNQKASPRDSRWSLLKEFFRLLEKTKPELVTMENVPKLAEKKVFKDFLKVLKRLNYYIQYKIVECDKYGIPQYRPRLVVIASRLGPIRLLEPGELKLKRSTVRDAIGKLAEISAGENCDKDPLHKSAALSKTNLNRIISSKPGGTWRDWNRDLIAKCHRKKTGKTYSGVYGRMEWDKPAPTLTTQFYGFGNGRFGHPEQNRAISLREGAILQGFPKRYKFVPKGEPIYIKSLGRLIGNAVPVKLGEVIGLSIVKHVEEYLASENKSKGKNRNAF